MATLVKTAFNFPGQKVFITVKLEMCITSTMI